MRAKYLIGLVLALIALALLLAGGTPIVRAQRDTGYTIDWWTVDGGGQTQPDGAGDYTPSGTIGQPDADGWSGGGYTLSGGFWGGGGGVEHTVYLPLILRSY
mgnify:FL=1